jgi:hypothetical protein
MALSATAVEILIEKGRFEPEVALGIAEAIGASMKQADLVTVAVLDARLQNLKSESYLKFGDLDANKLEAKIDLRFGELAVKMERIKAELVRWVFLVMLGNVALSAATTATLNALNHAK